MEIARDDDFPFFDYFSPWEDEDLPLAAEEEINELSQSTFKGAWKKVVELYETKNWLQRSVINSSGDTALHMAISDDKEDVVEKLVGSIVNKNNKKALKMQNNRGETPLHRAATKKLVNMCECILEAGHIMELDLLSITNKWGETPIFMAALYDRKHAFIFLHNAAQDAYLRDTEKPSEFLRRTDGSGDNALHSAIGREHFDLAFHVIILYPDLVGKSNVKGVTPLHVLASKPSAFRSGLRLSWWKQIIYYCIRVDKLKYDPTRTFTSRISAKKWEDKCPAPDNYLTCYQFLRGAYSFVKKIKEYWSRPSKSSGGDLGGKMKEEDDLEASNNSYVKKNIPQNYTTLYELLVFVRLILFRISGLELINEIRKEKEKHEWSLQILKELMEKHNTSYITEGGDPIIGRGKVFDPRQLTLPSTNPQVQKGNKGEDTDNKKNPNEEPEETHTPLLVAAQNGVIEVVNEILSQLPVTIYETTSKDKNILQVAVENRQPGVIEAVHKQVNKESKLNLWDDLVESVDIDGNNILHLAAKYKPQIQGSSALQMQQEIKWYEYVKSFMPFHCTFLTNKYGETPRQIFLRNHENLLGKSDEWLSRTSESCSVVAALVAGVAFATSSTVPGGNDDKTGKPTLEGHAGFDIFAVTALMALCFSVTALIMFLSLLTSRKQPDDFRKKIPVKLFLALSSLFVSIISMFISFCAGHSFVLEDKFKTSVLPLYVIVCLPVSFTIVEFPLYMDLFKGIFMKVPRRI